MMNLAEHAIPGPTGARPPVRRRATTTANPPFRRRDARWPELAAALAGLRAARRGSIRIVDADCGDGALLLRAVLHARALGFTAIEARGIDASPALVGRARTAASGVHDPAIGLTFEAADLVGALGDEADFPADIIIWHGRAGCSAEAARAVAAAGRTLIADPAGAAGAAA